MDGRKRDYPIFDQILFWGSAWLYSVLKLINWFLHRSSSRQRSPHLGPRLTTPQNEGINLAYFMNMPMRNIYLNQIDGISADLTFQNSITSKLIIQHYFKTRIVIVCYLVEVYCCIFELHFFHFKEISKSKREFKLYIGSIYLRWLIRYWPFEVLEIAYLRVLENCVGWRKSVFRSYGGFKWAIWFFWFYIQNQKESWFRFLK